MVRVTRQLMASLGVKDQVPRLAENGSVFKTRQADFRIILDTGSWDRTAIPLFFISPGRAI